jgi:hypothetical protein
MTNNGLALLDRHPLFYNDSSRTEAGMRKGNRRSAIRRPVQAGHRRPIVKVAIGDGELNAVLDAGSRRSYVGVQIAREFPTAPVQRFETRLGGEHLVITEGRFVSGVVRDSEGRAYQFSEVLFPVKDLGQEEGKRIDVLFGSIVLEDWGAVIDDSVTPPKIDYRLLREGELTELCT